MLSLILVSTKCEHKSAMWSDGKFKELESWDMCLLFPQALIMSLTLGRPCSLTHCFVSFIRKWTLLVSFLHILLVDTVVKTRKQKTIHLCKFLLKIHGHFKTTFLMRILRREMIIKRHFLCNSLFQIPWVHFKVERCPECALLNTVKVGRCFPCFPETLKSLGNFKGSDQRPNNETPGALWSLIWGSGMTVVTAVQMMTLPCRTIVNYRCDNFCEDTWGKAY